MTRSPIHQRVRDLTRVNRIRVHLPVPLLIVLAGLALASAAWAPPAAADGDPASDILVFQNVFASYFVSAGLQHDLTNVTTAMHRAGDPIKVAIITRPADLGAITPLFGAPRAYAKYLGIEIGSGPKKPLLVVMPNGYGSVGLSPAATRVLAGLPPPEASAGGYGSGTSPGDALALTTLAVLARIARVDGHPLPRADLVSPTATTVPFRVAARSALTLLLILGLAGAAWLVLLSLRWNGERLSTRLRRRFAGDLRRTLQTALGLLWLLDGALRVRAGFSSHDVAHRLSANASQQPGWFAACLRWAAGLVSHHVVVWNVAFAAVPILIGVALLWPRGVKAALVCSCVWGLLLWVFGEGLANLLAGTAQPIAGAPGAGILYLLISVLAWPGPRPAGLISPRGVRLVWSAIWLVMAWLWLSGANPNPGSLAQRLDEAPSGMSWLSSLQVAAANAVRGHGLVIALILAGVSVAIAIGVARESRWTRPALVLAVLLSVAYWVLGEGLGGLLTSRPTDPGTGPMLLILSYSVNALTAGRPSVRPDARAHTRRVITE